ncbi:cob(I)yrinic acid a,c-diamide adenosyltransferase [Porphyromonadaceae bacterium OttesenSCG-928-L07]|nr:cob(I)yrinic acid a,c-diamide adenosyltransferase [Porphyromonadaceae bacterium OttesenSCG-928-L07]MDL2251942.1 cob(I)yrinic acid a,c-diamide adenosyltransferase [Odoribacter sp. OttesenSCG-928-J03]
MKIYTKTGDKGMTSLIGGTRVPKNSLRLKAYGEVDELNAYLGLIRSFPIGEQYKEQLIRIQHILFDLGGNLATDTSVKECKVQLVVGESDVSFLEQAMDQLDELLPPLKTFVLPGGDQSTSFCHVARTVCRRVERRILDMSEECEVDELVLKFINRLSDYLFVLSRKVAMDSGVQEVAWKPGGRE